MLETSGRGKEKYVLVTCHDAISESIYDYLSETNKYRLFKAGNGREVVQQAKEISPDYILLDVQLPVLDGFTATKLIREFSPFTKTKIIFLSNLNDYEIRNAAIAAGANDYWIKPFKFSLLQKTFDSFR